MHESIDHDKHKGLFEEGRILCAKYAGRKKWGKKEYADASFARHNGSLALEVQKRFCGGKFSIPEGLQQKRQRGKFRRGKKGRENILDTLKVADI